MKEMKDFDISFFGLKEGKHHFEYKIDNQFFEAFKYDEYLDTKVLVNLELIKKTTLLELNFSTKGSLKIACDVSNEPYDQKLNGVLSVVVKFGEVYNDDNEEILIIPYGEYEINVAQFIYEMIVLAVPSKRIHPGIEDGTLQSPILKKLEELQYKDKKSDEIDPRWEELKKLITDKNT
jgi:uncharacterized metal-binding protein YceD (DUF177 family)